MYGFDYQRPTDTRSAIVALQGDARYLAGGQSLVQAMRLRLSQSERLVDLGGVAELKGIRMEGEQLVVGAMTTHAEVAASAQVRQVLPALAELAGMIADPMVRNMGTLGGSIANADPAADYPAAVVALDAVIQTDRRTIAGSRFFVGLYQTALEPGELITAVRFARPQLAAYEKLRQPASRFALVGVFVAKVAGAARVGVTGVKSSAFRALPIEAALDASFTPDAARAVRLPSDDVNGDMHGSPEYRAAMVSVIAARAVAAALGR